MTLLQSAAEAVDPIVLDARMVEVCDCRSEGELTEIPAFIARCFDGELSTGGDLRRIYVTLGQFSIVRLERDTQLLIPVYDYCLPDKECSCSTGGGEDPCSVFRNIHFPVGEFFPPNTVRMPENYEETRSFCGGCK